MNHDFNRAMPHTGRPAASSDAVRARMSKQRQRDTTAETDIRRALHALGMRFRVDVKIEKDLRVRGDIVWGRMKFVVFVDGCFWHSCPEHATRPAANSKWWAAKLDGNVARDRRTDKQLADRGWTVSRFWEHEPPEAVASAIAETHRKLSSVTRNLRANRPG